MITSPKLIATPTWPSCAGLGVDHDRAAAGEDEREGADELRRQQPRERAVDHPGASAQFADALSSGSSSAISFCTRCVELVADPAHRLEVLAGRVVELPVLVALARVDRAGIAAAHRDHDVGGAHDLVGERLGELLAHVDAELLHRVDDGRVDLVRRSRAGRADVDPPLRAQLDEAGGHLAAPGVVHADEQHLGLVLVDDPLRLGERLQPLAGEAVREHRHEDVDLRARRAGRCDSAM